MSCAEKTNRQFITLTDSKALYGCASLLMILHHCFCIPSRLNYDYIPVLGGYDVEARIAWLGKLCVALYAFISGYAFAMAARRNCEECIWRRFLADCLTSVRKLFKFYSVFWLVFAIFIPIGIAFFDKSAHYKDIIAGLLEGGGGYNGEWWYIAEYQKFLMLYPVLECVTRLLENKRSRACTCLILLGGLTAIAAILMFAWNSPVERFLRPHVNELDSNYVAIFVSAFLIGRFGLFERLDRMLRMPPFLFGAAIIACILFRCCYVKEPAQSDCDVFLTPVLVFASVRLIHTAADGCKTLGALRYVGRHSTAIWLTHTFWIYYYFQPLILLPRYSVLILLWATAISLCGGIVVDYLYQRIGMGVNGLIRRISSATGAK